MIVGSDLQAEGKYLSILICPYLIVLKYNILVSAYSALLIGFDEILELKCLGEFKCHNKRTEGGTEIHWFVRTEKLLNSNTLGVVMMNSSIKKIDLMYT